MNNLINRSIKSDKFALILFWELNYLANGKYKLFYKKYQNLLVQKLNSKLRYLIKKQENFIEYLKINFKETITCDKINEMDKYFQDLNLYNKSFPIVTNPYLNLIKVDFKNIKIKLSSSKPIIIPCLTKNNYTKKIKYVICFIKKKIYEKKKLL